MRKKQIVPQENSVKFVIQSLHFGDVIEAEVSELLTENEVIMSFQGDLLRVQNHSRSTLKVGEKLNCRVTSIDPLRFEMVQTCRPSPPFKMDRII